MKNRSENLLLIFTRNPELGKCKTRLAKTIGNQNALAIYKILLHHTANIAGTLSCDKAVYYSEKVNNKDIWQNNIYQKFEQNGADLGQRMLHAFTQSFKSGYHKVVIMGSDVLDLKKEHVEKAFAALDKNDVVLGPANDGGYYLLGMRELHPALFHHKKWGTNSVFKETLADLAFQKVALLEPLNDIDIYEDIINYPVFKPFLV